MVDIKNELNKIEKKGLKDFQKATVERIDKLFREHQNRILVSDEVGLGKTLVARGVVAKFVKLRKEENDDLVKVVYICSNINIAKQNLARLRIADELKKEGDENPRNETQRLSMQHLNIFNSEYDKEVKKRYIQLIPLTPDTSFRVTRGQGLAAERALMFVLLKEFFKLKGNGFIRRLSNTLKYEIQNEQNWKKLKGEYEDKVKECNKKSHGKYLEYMITKIKEEIDKCEDIKNYFDTKEKKDLKISQKQIIGKLRSIFAKISLDKLEPDLIIMDEFQRFKELIRSKQDSDMGMIVKKFFNNEDTRILLLSATPFKMYSTLEEIQENNIDEHWTEFHEVIKFLNNKNFNRFEEVWKDYAVSLKEYKSNNLTILNIENSVEDDLLKKKNKAEEELYNYICRTERYTEKALSDPIYFEKNILEIKKEDIESYCELSDVLNQLKLKCSLPVEYVKSCPYLLSFMKEYQIKRDIVDEYNGKIKGKGRTKKLDSNILKNKNNILLKYKDIDYYRELNPNNAKLEYVIKRLLPDGIENLLWVPPAKPYYEPQGIFKNFDLFSKTIIFSAWEMVPRMISCMFSYEIERRIMVKYAKKHRDILGKDIKYILKDRRPSPRMNFAVKNEKATDLTLFCLLYPSNYLTNIYNPISYLKGYSLDEIKNDLRQNITEKLKEFPDNKDAKEDFGWYYLFPLLADNNKYDNNKYVNDWFENCENYLLQEENTKGFEENISELKDLYEGGTDSLGRRPDDLVDVLVDMAIASPAICLNRSYSRYKKHQKTFDNYLPTEGARSFINMLNTPEATAVVELVCRDSARRRRHWRDVLKYCVDGNLQSTLDEYIHFLSSGLDNDEYIIDNIHEDILDSLDLRTSTYSIDTDKTFSQKKNKKKNKKKGSDINEKKSINMRTNYAVAFAKVDNEQSDRKNKIRNAFNSPFKPFVLASTSIGQEGLDFHAYCRKIVHWNLPNNPIDLEQREGRINRFKCHAIRQNIARRYGNLIDGKNADLWEEMFIKAREEEKLDKTSDLIPYWGLKDMEKFPEMVKIERIVPMYPLSKDLEQYEKIIKILSLYRLALGQARQEEFLEYIVNNNSEEDIEKLSKLFITLSPYYKKVAQE